ncbi:Fyv7p NDAI_0C06530 [Naumovozyma dairenensis CBS 421]|uniref:rRNA-processing protein FYV7 n=1 Tax=Naumovozyma dairenensis (strain ATCC 10597 / BCRC 20456 / CBS 421 / NBRC 0211 / NRRL Y-12639) TaxID=1071378 RepID=G0W951_NAUDC|nr:hypothetical protein NDAI_0C06530 [Naumovozyma dairenensis CBS 421]CCD24312.1 hypothetical protein NDAI_0C06530 [Naumovozyma dairenensis CBS 421]
MATFKQQHNRKKFTREYKVKEIQRSITKKTRLKKEYFKALKDEGYTVPEKKGEDNPVKRNVKKLKEERALQGKQKLDEKKAMKRERKKLQKEQIQDQRKQEMERIQMSKEKHMARERRKTRMTQKTRSGQPKMGPKIDDY